MFRTALRNVLAHKARLLMTVLAVTLGVAFVSGTLVYTDTFGEAFKKSSAKSFTNVSVAIRPDESASGHSPFSRGQTAKQDPKLTDALLKRAGGLPGAESATGVLSGSVSLADKHGKPVGQTWGTTGGNYYPATTKGADTRYHFTDGRAPKTSAEIALDSKTAERTGYKIGDLASVSTNGPVTEQKITGIFDTDDGKVAAGGTLVLFDNATAHKVLGKTGEYDEITVKAVPGAPDAALKNRIEKILPQGTEAVTGKTLADEQAAQITQETDDMSHVLLCFAGIALFVGIFLIANTFTMLVAQRSKEVALLRAIGASRRQVTRSVLTEAVIIGLVASVSGFLLGLGIAAGMRAAMGSASMPDGPLVVAPSTGIYALLVGVGVTVLAAWLPGRRSARIPPVAAMNSVHATPTTRSLVLRNSIGSLAVVGGAAGVLFTTGMKLSDAVYPLGLSTALLIIGVFMLTPLLARPVIAAAAPLLDRFGVAGKLARRNALRNPRRTAATAAALMIGLSLITSMTVVAVSVQGASDDRSVTALKSDYVISMANGDPLSPDVRKTLDTLPEVTASSPRRLTGVVVDGARTPTGISGVDMKSIGELLNVNLTSGSAKNLSASDALVDSETADKAGLKAGDAFAVKFHDGKAERLTVAGVYEGNAGNKMFIDSGIRVSTTVVDKHLATVADDLVLVKVKGGPSSKAEDTIVKALGQNPAIDVLDKKALSDKYSLQVNLMLNVLYGLLAMALVIAVLGVVNTLAMSVFERRHEIGMLRATGLARAKTKQMVRLESIVISLFGAVLGIGLGICLAWAIGTSITNSLPTYTMTIPYPRIALFLLMAGAIGMVAAAWPARHAAKLNALDAIKTE
ncbi:FtsX-like permease family protein [Streptomyces sp. BA2]|uniref:FtsX-like permease family protein n=1 Tax=Streptomyces sp. BA2 TaxID=436595 RepID=UPI001326E0AC|nr:FtsX-like permease family protein [Streptomyces sp. BA2]